MNKGLKYLISVIQLLFIVGLLLTSVDYNCFNLNFYRQEYEKLNTAETIGMSQDDLIRSTSVLLDYTRDKRSDMTVHATVKGVEREVFNERETAHMVDVKNLYLNAMTARNLFLIAETAMIIILIAVKKMNMTVFWETFKTAALAFFFVMAFFMLFALVDFDSFWRSFHEIFFTNDLWLLDPRVDIMIMMVPLEFFYDLVMRIVLLFAACFVCFGGGLFVLKRKGISQ